MLRWQPLDLVAFVCQPTHTLYMCICGMYIHVVTTKFRGMICHIFCSVYHSPLQTNQVYIMDRPVFFNYSTSQEITR